MSRLSVQGLWGVARAQGQHGARSGVSRRIAEAFTIYSGMGKAGASPKHHQKHSVDRRLFTIDPNHPVVRGSTRRPLSEQKLDIPPKFNILMPLQVVDKLDTAKRNRRHL